jgi:hypothetical protein
MEHSPSWEANSLSATQIPHILRHPTFITAFTTARPTDDAEAS